MLNMLEIIVSLFLLVLFQDVSALLGLYEGDKCNSEKGGWDGICKDIRECSLIGNVKSVQPPICGFNGPQPIICCPTSPSTTTPQMEHSTSPTTNPTTASLINEKITKKDFKASSLKSNGAAISYCFHEFHDNDCGRSNFAKREITWVVTGGKESKPKAHPHMALLGYGPETSKEWLCGGSLINERYILTAAHCKSSHRLGEVSWVRLGELDISKKNEEGEMIQEFRVNTFHQHPDYNNSTVYNDIALIELDKKVVFNSWVHPACLETDSRFLFIFREVVASGWGRTDFVGPTSDTLMEVDLSIIETEKCKKQLGRSLKMPKGLDEETMLCAGNDEGGKDTCSGDSGGPLELKDNRCLKTVVGVTSFGKQCGLPNSPGLYTKVSYYIPWIESIAWPAIIMM